MTLLARPVGRTEVEARPALALRRDGSGRPRVSGTFVLDRSPRPDERLGPLVQRAVLAVDLEVDGLGTRPVAGVTWQLVHAGVPLAEVRVDGAFARGALQATLDGGVAAELLDAMLGGPSGLELRGAVRRAPTASTATRVRVHLGRLWSLLDAAADETRVFRHDDLHLYTSALLDRGDVVVESGGPEAALQGVLKAARVVLEPQADGYRLSEAAPGDQVVTTTSSTTDSNEEVLDVAAPVEALVAPAIADDLEHHLHVVSQDGGVLAPVLPVRSARRARDAGSGSTPHVLHAGAVVSVATLLHPTPAPLTPLTAQPHALPVGALVANPAVLALGSLHIPPADQVTPGPLVGGLEDPLWPDREDPARSWYLPELTLVVPDPADDPEAAAFRFEVEPEAGHGLDGSQAIVAAITVQLVAHRSAATTAAWEAAGRPDLQPVPLSSLLVQLAIPFRDEDGVARVERVTADSVVVDGTLGADGSTVVATFRLLDRWARLAYGALSTSGFQARPAALVVSASFEGWRRQRAVPPILGLDKRWAIAAARPSRRSGGTSVLGPLHGGPLLHAAIHPAWAIRPELLDVVKPDSYQWAQFSTSREVEAFVACQTHGTFYRERVDGQWRPVGCRPALQLGQTQYRTYEELPTTAAAGHAKVYRSLRSPGRFLVVPAQYGVGRYPADDERAYRPKLFLHSTIDVDDPTNIRCVLAAALEPVLPPYVRAALLAELRALHPEPVLEYLPDAGVPPDVRWAAPAGARVECVATATGFDVLVSSDVASFLVLKSLLDRDGLRGVAALDLPGGVRASASLAIDLGCITGPFDGGPVTVSEVVDGAVTVTNRAGVRVAFRGLAQRGASVCPADELLEAGASTTCTVGPAAPPFDVVFEQDRGSESLEEVRAYVDDLEVGLTFVAHGLAGAGLAALEVRTSFLGHAEAEPLVLTEAIPERQRSFVMPLTTFAADPVLEFTVTAVAADGTRTDSPPVSWPVRTRGAVVPIGPPA